MYIYCLTHASSLSVINRDTMHVKWRILRFKITVFWITGPCNLTGRYHGFVRTQCFHLLTDCDVNSDCSSKRVINMQQLYTVLNQTILWILTTVSTSNPIANNIKNNWSADGNFTLGKLNYRKAVYFLQI